MEIFKVHLIFKCTLDWKANLIFGIVRKLLSINGYFSIIFFCMKKLGKYLQAGDGLLKGIVIWNVMEDECQISEDFLRLK